MASKQEKPKERENVQQFEKLLSVMEEAMKHDQMHALPEDKKSDYYKRLQDMADKMLGCTRSRTSSPPPKNVDSSIRIASWNILNFCNSRAHRVSGLKIDLVRDTINEYEFDIVALQEVGNRKDDEWVKSPISKLVTKLKELDPDAGWTLARTDSPIGRLYSGVSAYGTFLYKRKNITLIRGVHSMSEAKTTLKDEKKFGRDPVYAAFQTRNENCLSLVNFHLTPMPQKVTPGEAVKNVDQFCQLHEIWAETMIAVDEKSSAAEGASAAKKTMIPDDEYPILLGDFNNYVKTEEMELGKRHSYENLFGPKEYTNTSQNKCYDAIIVHASLKEKCRGHGVEDIAVKGNLEQKNISDHKPIWADFDL